MTILLIAALSLAAKPLWACGLCHEDDRAAVYSYPAMQKVEAHPDQLEFVVIKISGPLTQLLVNRLEAWLKKQEGVDSETVKLALNQKAMGFVFKKSASFDALLAGLAKEFRKLHFTKKEPVILTRP